MRFLRNDPTLKQRRRELRRNQSDAERAFWAKVRDKQFFGMKFFRQYSVGPYILDFYCPTSPLTPKDPFVLIWNDPWDAQLLSWQI